MTILKTLAITFGIIVATGAGLGVWATSTLSPEQTAILEAKVAAEQRRLELRHEATRCGKAVQQNLNDPASFELVNYQFTEKGVTIVYRARNGFNALVAATASCPLSK